MNEADLSLFGLVSRINSVQSAILPPSQPYQNLPSLPPLDRHRAQYRMGSKHRLSNLLVQQLTQLSERLTTQITHLTHLTLEIKHPSRTYAYLAATFNTTHHLRIANENFVTHPSSTLLDKLETIPFHVLGLRIPALKWG